ncbi:hypothetical protein [Halobaculum sp. D14]|uniref:hypothetical protein n=1 Tax=Halobaculum sp. D14 TaxID=3421642 RepID=UPI003EB71D83
MASLLAFGLLAVAVAVHTLVAAVLARFFRIRLNTRWGWVAYSFMITPLVLVFLTMVSGMVIPPVFTSAPLLLAVMVGVPLALGFTIDVLYVPPPEEYELPESAD